MRFLFLFLAFIGCATSQPERFELPTGEATECLRYEQEECGMALRACGAEHTVDFECLSDVRYVGPSAKVAPAPKPEKADDRCREALEKKDAALIQKHRCYPPDYYVDPRDEEVSK